MLRKIAAAISAVSLLFCLTSCSLTEIPKTEITHQTEVPPKMLFLGDSIAAGYGLDGYTSKDNYNCNSYSNILKEKYESELGDECGHIMINKAVSGYTSDDLIKQIQSGELDGDLKETDAVVISIGGNDLLGILLELLDDLGISKSGEFDSDSIDFFGAATAFLGMDGDVNKALDKFSENIRIITEELHNRTDGKIFVQTLYDPLAYFDSFKIITDFSDEKIGELNSIIAGNAPENYTVIDVAADFKERSGELTNISKFDIHPNAEGHEVIAEDVDKAFRAAGFSYVTVEEGEKRLTGFGKKAILGGVICAILIFRVGTIIIFRKRK